MLACGLNGFEPLRVQRRKREICLVVGSCQIVVSENPRDSCQINEREASWTSRPVPSTGTFLPCRLTNCEPPYRRSEAPRINYQITNETTATEAFPSPGGVVAGARGGNGRLQLVRPVQLPPGHCRSGRDSDGGDRSGTRRARRDRVGDGADATEPAPTQQSRFLRLLQKGGGSSSSSN
jgi:hypothetical protein